MKNVQIRFKKGDINTTITVKESVLNLYSNTFFDKPYNEKKRFINAQIKNLVNPQTKNLSQLVTKFLLDLVQKKIDELKSNN